MRNTKLMNRGWKFYFGEPAFLRARAESSDQTYRGTRAASGRGPARRDFDDSAWETVHLPHDFVALNGISETDAHRGEHFDFPMDRGSAWYRRYFTLSEDTRDRRIVLHFEGMGTFCEVYVNSMLMKTNRTNGIGFDVDITDIALFGDEQNVVAVHCDCHDYEAWYYEGGGITRNVWLKITDRLSVDLWGTFVRSAREDDRRWRVLVDTEVRNDYGEPRSAEVLSEILDASGAVVASFLSERGDIAPRTVRTFRQSVVLTDPALWSPESPALYTLRTKVLSCGEAPSSPRIPEKSADAADSSDHGTAAPRGQADLPSGAEVTDTCETTFGIRELVFDKDRGLLVNGKKTVIYGFANHMLYLGVGEALTDSMAEYQIRTLYEMGGNGYRTAHSPHPEAVMDYCDRFGLLVMDENRNFRTSDIVLDEVRRMIRRDRNHPSVCMWSVYNEEDFVTTDTGRRIFRTLKDEVLKLDPTRPVTGATSYGMFSEGAHEDYDLFGFNHQTMHFDALRRMHPDKPIFCSEMIIPLGKQRDFGSIQVRTGEDARQLQKDYVVGGFHFTAWGYGPERPEIIGMEGTLGTGYYGFRAYLKPDEPLAKICPGWDFPGKEGKPVELNLANNGDTVRVYVNGALKDTIPTDLYAITPYTLTYEPGELRIKVLREGKLWAEDRAVTPGAPARLELVLENAPGTLAADGTDAAIVSAYVTDEEGNRCLHETGRLVRFDCNDCGELITTESLRDDLFQGHVGREIRCFDGKCQALVRSLEAPGDLVVRAGAEGLAPAEITIPRRQARITQVPETPCGYVNGWRISGLIPGGMDDEAIIRARATERWLPVDTLGTPVLVPPANRRIPEGASVNYAYYARTVIPAIGDPAEGEVLCLRFIGIDGRADIYVTDGRKTAMGHHPADSPWFGHYRPELIVPCGEFSPGDAVEIWVMMHDVGRVHGIGWPVHWTYKTPGEIRALEEQTAREWSYHKMT